MKTYKIILLSLLSGTLLALPGMDFFPGYLMFFGFVPILILEDFFYKEKDKYVSSIFFLYTWLSFAFWNFLTMWWAWIPSIFGLLGPVVLNSLLSALVFWIFHAVRIKSGNKIGYFTFVIFYLGFEYLHHNWELAYPWLTLGNNFAKEIYAIQWYEFTGVLGGSLWILVTNLLVFSIYKNYKEKKKISKYLIYICLVVIIPVIISVIIFYNYQETENSRDVLIIQPNIDPNTEKFDKLTVEQQLERMFTQAESEITDDVDFVIFPETAIAEFIKESNLTINDKLLMINDFFKVHPQTNVIIGAMTYKQFSENEDVPNSALKVKGSDFYYDYYNSALLLDSTGNIQIYHKSQLLMGAEKMPLVQVFKFLKKINIEIAGGTTWYGTQKEATVFQVNNDTIQIAPVICWESVFGEYNSDFVNKGADFITIITNDGWWGNTNGHKQHLRVAQIRAIETRRDIARCANTGISAIINQKGQIVVKTKYWEQTEIKGYINTNSKMTFYTKHGDWIGKICALLSILVLVYLVFNKIKLIFK